MIEHNFNLSDFNIQTAYYLANACKAAYDDSLDNWKDKLADGFIVSKIDGLSCFSGMVDGHFVISFRGTNSIKNWITDGQIAQMKDPSYDGKVHVGFATAANALWKLFEDKLPSILTRIYVTGHSLGGAIATLVAQRLVKLGYKVVVYTFGSPRVGNQTFCDGCKFTHYRFVNNDDIVPRVPLEINILFDPFVEVVTYYHTGTLKQFDKTGNLKALGGFLTDHFIDHYLRVIEFNLEP